MIVENAMASSSGGDFVALGQARCQAVGRMPPYCVAFWLSIRHPTSLEACHVEKKMYYQPRRGSCEQRDAGTHHDDRRRRVGAPRGQAQDPSPVAMPREGSCLPPSQHVAEVTGPVPRC